MTEILYESPDVIIGKHGDGMSATYNSPELEVYHYTTYNTPLYGKPTQDWLHAGTWILRKDNKWHAENSYGGISLDIYADTLEDIAEYTRSKNMKRLRKSVTASDNGLFSLSPTEYRDATTHDAEYNIRRALTYISKSRGFLSGAFNVADRDIYSQLNEISEHLTKAYDLSLKLIR